MNIHLTNEQPPRLQVTCKDRDEYQALRCGVDVLARHTENLEASKLVPNPGSEMLKGLKQNMSATLGGNQEEVVFVTNPAQQDVLSAVATVAINTLENRLAAESRSGLLAGHVSELPMQATIRLQGLMAGILAWKERQAVFDAVAQPLEAPTASQG